MEIDALLAPTRDQPPCGPGLEYDPEFQELERAVQGKPEQVLGDRKIPAVPPNWPDVRERATALLGRSKDLRVAVWLARALTRLENLPGLVSGLGLIEGLLTRFWEDLHPQPDPDDKDLTLRLNTLAALTDSQSLQGDLRSAVLVQASSHEKFTVRDAEVALGRLPAASGASPSQAQIEAALREAAGRGQDVRGSVAAALRSCQSIGNLIAEKVGAQYAPDLRPLTSVLQSLLALAGPEAGSGSSEAEVETDAEVAVGPSDVLAAPKGLRNRDDALRLLDTVCEYLEQHEPTNPAPLLIRRAQRLMSMDFLQIIQDLAPDSLGQVKKIAGPDKP